MKNKIFFSLYESTLSVTINGKVNVITLAEGKEGEDELKQVRYLIEDANAAIGSKNEEERFDALIEHFDPIHLLLVEGKIKKTRSGKWYMNRINLKLPQEFVDMYISYVKAGIDTTALENFWKLLVLNPDKHVRKSLFSFAANYKFPILPNGQFVAYKSVAWASEKFQNYATEVSRAINNMAVSGYGVSHKDEQLYVIRSADYKKVRLQSIKETQNSVDDYFNVYPEIKKEIDQTLPLLEKWKAIEIYELTTHEWVEADQKNLSTDLINAGLAAGTLRFGQDGVQLLETTIPEKESLSVITTIEDAFAGLGDLLSVEGYEFTDHYSKTSEIHLGEPVSMNREDCDNNPNAQCSEGLHLGAPSYVKSFGHSERFVLACLCNPMNVVAVPYADKLRTCEYYPFAIAKMIDGKVEELNNDVAIENYQEVDMKNIEDRLKEINESDESWIDVDEAGAIVTTIRTNLEAI